MNQLTPLNTPLRTDLRTTALVQSGGRFYQYRGIILLIMLALVLWLNLTFLKPLLMGAIIATVLHPMIGWFDRTKVTKKIPHVWRAGAITLGFFLLILIPLGLLLFAGVQAVISKIQNLDLSDLSSKALGSTFINNLGLSGLMNRIYNFLPISQDQTQMYLTKGLAAAGAWGGATLQDLVTSLPGVAFSNFVLLLTLFFLLVDGPRAVQFLRHNSIFNQEQTNKLIATTRALCDSVIVATIISGAAQASIVALFCFFTGTHGILLFTFLTFVSSFFPVIGTTPVVLFIALQAFVGGETIHGIVWLIASPIVGTVDNIVRPYVLKGGAELHPLIGFVAAFGALDMIGFYGLFIGPIVAGLFFALLPMVTRTYPRRTAIFSR
jgi:predicted PurR-regulated permease PerM